MIEKVNLGGLDLALVPVDDLRPNPWNPNEMDRDLFEKAKASIRENGFLLPVVVREQPGPTPYEIVDGFHRWLACKQEGHASIQVINLGTITDHKAKRLTVILNELRGRAEPVKLATVIADIVEGHNVEELLRTLPYRAAEVASMVQSVRAFDWTEAGSLRQSKGADKNANGEKPFQLGALKGTVPDQLCEALLALYSRTANECGSRTPEAVLGAWLRILQDRGAGTQPLPEARS